MTSDPAAIARTGLMELARTDGASMWIDAHGPSMAPTIPAGSRLLVEFGHHAGRIGEVVLTREGDRLTAHRLVARRTVAGQAMVVTKGDGEAFADAAIPADAVLGIVRGADVPGGPRGRSLLGGRRGAALARSSWLGDRLARAGRRLARPLPTAIRTTATSAAVSLSRVPTRVLVATLLRLDRRPFAERR